MINALLATDDRLAATDGLPATGDRPSPTDEHLPATGVRLPAIDDGFPATEVGCPATDRRLPATGDAVRARDCAAGLPGFPRFPSLVPHGTVAAGQKGCHTQRCRRPQGGELADPVVQPNWARAAVGPGAAGRRRRRRTAGTVPRSPGASAQGKDRATGPSSAGSATGSGRSTGTRALAAGRKAPREHAGS